ncbi:uncharacterized protein LOC135714554 [Ochlerotatus camptorhynchus]|uniref:uncharacterized protein LOC135714554 n=1 Tax=Ochlerotatus camptorhynchus TaxID=644619 RepID=UPI0031D62B84
MEKTSKVYKLSPFLDEHGVMRVDSRLSAAPYATFSFKYPIILPRDHRMTELLLDAYYRKILHGNQETVVNELRQQFLISKLRTVVNRVIKDFQYCEIKKAKPIVPRMAPTYSSFHSVDTPDTSSDWTKCREKVDCFIHLFINKSSINLDVTYSLLSKSCKLAICRFIARRGAPCEIYTDNGTNFQGASR